MLPRCAIAQRLRAKSTGVTPANNPKTHHGDFAGPQLNYRGPR